MGLSVALFSCPVFLDGYAPFCDVVVLSESLFLSFCAVQDDLASEGLLLIRVQPDERGRYGFNVKVAYT